jgi:hypothetical protein
MPDPASAVADPTAAPPATPTLTTPPADPATLSAPPATDPNTAAPKPPSETLTEAPKPEGAPEKYEFKLPDGLKLDEGLAAKFEPVAKELNLTNAQAQKLADAFAAHQLDQAKAQTAAYTQQLTDWVKAVSADPEIGGPGDPRELPSVKNAQAAVARFASPALKTYLEQTGIGSHPEFVRTFAAIGKLLSEDAFHAVGRKPEAPKSPAAVLWPDKN